LSGLRLLAELLEPVDGHTPSGEWTRSYVPLGVVWLKTAATRRREKSDGVAIRTVEAMTVETRTDPRLAEGRVLRFGGGDWSLIGLQGTAARPGRVELVLERGR